MVLTHVFYIFLCAFSFFYTINLEHQTTLVSTFYIKIMYKKIKVPIRFFVKLCVGTIHEGYKSSLWHMMVGVHSDLKIVRCSVGSPSVLCLDAQGITPTSQSLFTLMNIGQARVDTYRDRFRVWRSLDSRLCGNNRTLWSDARLPLRTYRHFAKVRLILWFQTAFSLYFYKVLKLSMW